MTLNFQDLLIEKDEMIKILQQQIENSMIEVERECMGKVIGVVIFARGKCPSWVTPIFNYWDVSQQHEKEISEWKMYYNELGNIADKKDKEIEKFSQQLREKDEKI